MSEIEEKRAGWINLLLKEDPDLVGHDNPLGKWLPMSQLKNPIRRSICANEIVFDIDAKNWKACYELAKQLENVLNEWIIPFLRFTSGNWLHYHVFINNRTEIPIPIIKDYFKDREEYTIKDVLYFVHHDLKKALFKFITNLTKPVSGAKFDVGVMEAERHLIRFEGSRNEKTGFYKSLLPSLPKEKPKVRQEEVIIPEEIPHWKVPQELIYYVYRKFVRQEKPKVEKILKEEQKESNETKTYWQIEKLLQTPIPDGRHRAVDLLIAPYLITIKKLDHETASKVIWEWVENCKKLRYTKITQTYVRSKLRYVERKQLMPLSFEGVEKWFPDVPEVLAIWKSKTPIKIKPIIVETKALEETVQKKETEKIETKNDLKSEVKIEARKTKKEISKNINIERLKEEIIESIKYFTRCRNPADFELESFLAQRGYPEEAVMIVVDEMVREGILKKTPHEWLRGVYVLRLANSMD